MYTEGDERVQAMTATTSGHAVDSLSHGNRPYQELQTHSFYEQGMPQYFTSLLWVLQWLIMVTILLHVMWSVSKMWNVYSRTRYQCLTTVNMRGIKALFFYVLKRKGDRVCATYLFSRKQLFMVEPSAWMREKYPSSMNSFRFKFAFPVMLQTYFPHFYR